MQFKMGVNEREMSMCAMFLIYIAVISGSRCLKLGDDSFCNWRPYIWPCSD